MTTINANNRKAVSFYDSLASDIPGNIWLTYYFNKEGDKVAIEGLSTTINDIYRYFNSLKVISPESSIKLTKLKVITDLLTGSFNEEVETDVRLYDFEISNTTSRRAAARGAAEEGGEGGGEHHQSEEGGGGIAPRMLLEPLSDFNFTN
jgi:Tfp pilus assembly protein PilN